MKKLIILTLVAITFTVASFGQQVPMYSHYYFNRFLYNPAMTGEQSYGQAYLIYRNQWNSVPDAPVTKAFTLDGPLSNKKVGLGVSLYQDQAGVFNSTGGRLSYRYGLKLSDESTLNFGIGLGFLDNRIDFNQLNPKDPNDNVILNQYKNETGVDATFGVNYIYKDFQIGLAVPQVLANELAYESLSGTVNGEQPVFNLVRHYVASVRYDFDINDKLSFEPIAMVRATPGAPLQYDVNAMFNYDDKFWLGGMYRSQYAATFSAATRVMKSVVAGYSYDLAVNANKQYLRGAHEVMLGYHFGDKDDMDKKIKDLDDRIKKNKDDIKKNRDDIDSNDEEIEDNKEELDEENEKLRKELEELKSQFEKFQQDAKNGNLNTGDIIGFENVYFETNKWDIREVDVAELDKLVEIMKENPNMSLAIMGHADMRGSVALNQKLSRERANSVRNYLISKGVESYRLRIESFGESKPASSDLDENRRVEFKVLSK